MNILVTVLFALAPWFFYPPGAKEEEFMYRFLDISLVLLALGSSHGIFLYAFYREYKRTVGAAGGTSGRPRSRRKVKSGPREE